MNQTTDTLIATLAKDLKPVKRMPDPSTCLLCWVVLALPVSLLLGSVVEQQHVSLAIERIHDPRVVLELVTILATALSAGYAALVSTQPGRNEKIWLLPVVPFLGWLSLVSESCWRLIEEVVPVLFSYTPHWTCFPSVVATGFAPALLMVMLLRRGAFIRPILTVVLGTLAASALGAVGLRLYHPPDATALLLIWQFIAMVMFLGAAALISAYISRRS